MEGERSRGRGGSETAKSMDNVGIGRAVKSNQG